MRFNGKEGFKFLSLWIKSAHSFAFYEVSLNIN